MHSHFADGNRLVHLLICWSGGPGLRDTTCMRCARIGARGYNGAARGLKIAVGPLCSPGKSVAQRTLCPRWVAMTSTIVFNCHERSGIKSQAHGTRPWLWTRQSSTKEDWKILMTRARSYAFFCSLSVLSTLPLWFNPCMAPLSREIYRNDRGWKKKS